MKIRYLGHSCFQLIAEDGTCILTDPYTKVGAQGTVGGRCDGQPRAF